jgi:dolichol kinase
MVVSLPLLVYLPDYQLIPTATLAAILVVIIYAISAISSHKILAGIVAGSIRERDYPNGNFFFFFPLIAGNIALVIAIMIFPIDLVRVAFFTVAIADGFAEPVGIRWGEKTRYYVKDHIWKTKNTKSVHGSANVFAWSFLICLFLLWISGFPLSIENTVKSFFYSMVITAVEALSPRGMDNMLIFLVGSGVLYLLL